MTDYRPVLYHRSLSLECLRVRRLIAQLHVDIDLRDVLASRDHREELEELAGHVRVPCLVLGGTVIAEPDEILRYLRLRYGQGQNPPARP